MRLSEQERTAAQADLDRLTGELVRLYQLREQLKLALIEGEKEDLADAVGSTGTGGVGSAGGSVDRTGAEAVSPAFRLILGAQESAAPRDEAQRQTLRSQLAVIRGGRA